MKKNSFHLSSLYQPCGDQPQAIGQLVDGLQKGYRYQTLLGVTGSGKTFTMANVIAQIGLPTIIISHNKTLAAQLYSEMRAFFLIMQWSTLLAIMTIINRGLCL